MCSEHLPYSGVGQNHKTQSIFDNKVLSISCNPLHVVLKWEAELLYGHRWASGYQLLTLMTAWLMKAAPGNSYPIHMRTGQHITSPGRDPNSKIKVHLLLNAYCCCTIMKSIYHKLTCCKLETICSHSANRYTWPGSSPNRTTLVQQYSHTRLNSTRK